mmetsp:Transcript_8388/g.22416  ORF Transcript_8388/g.22416 Transcript_8388/m.22416 type:complete len:331 (+) Transcript_8388:1842-2834(+)
MNRPWLLSRSLRCSSFCRASEAAWFICAVASASCAAQSLCTPRSVVICAWSWTLSLALSSAARASSAASSSTPSLALPHSSDTASTMAPHWTGMPEQIASSSSDGSPGASPGKRSVCGSPGSPPPDAASAKRRAPPSLRCASGDNLDRWVCTLRLPRHRPGGPEPPRCRSTVDELSHALSFMRLSNTRRLSCWYTMSLCTWACFAPYSTSCLLASCLTRSIASWACAWPSEASPRRRARSAECSPRPARSVAIWARVSWALESTALHSKTLSSSSAHASENKPLRYSRAVAIALSVKLPAPRRCCPRSARDAPACPPCANSLDSSSGTPR